MWDKKRGVVFPLKYSNELAELFGIYAGDGCLHVCRRGTAVEYRFVVTGNATESSYLEYVNSLVKLLFNLSSAVGPRHYLNRNWSVLIYRSKGIVTYFEEKGYPPGRKEHISIPVWILDDDVFSLNFLRGLFDTDGHLAIVKKGRFNAYPVISIQLKPKEIIEEVFKLLEGFGFKANAYFDVAEKDRRTNKFSIKNHIYLNGWRNFILWKNIVGSSNQKNIEKINRLDAILANNPLPKYLQH